MQDINGIALVDEDLEHHKVHYDEGDNHGVILVDGVDALEVRVRKGDRTENSP